MSSIIEYNLQEAIELKESVLGNHKLIASIHQISDIIVTAYREGKKVLFCGNGGSAADAQHLAAELTGRYYYDRPPLHAEALHTNSSYLTAVSNDYSYEYVFERMIEAIGKKGDILIGLSTSGNSLNIVNAFKMANTKGLKTIAFTGETGGELRQYSDYTICIPSKNTPRIQELHMLIGHTICEYIERAIFPREGQELKQEFIKNILPNINKQEWTLFLDRDGVINKKIDGYVCEIPEFQWAEGAVDAIVGFQEYFHKILIVTNQQGIGKGLMTEQELFRVHKYLVNEIEQRGGRIDGIYFAPSLESEQSEMRKPNIGMALKAKEDFPSINFEKSIMIGDSQSDMEFAKNAGMHRIFINKNNHNQYFTLPSLTGFHQLLKR